MLIRDGLFKGLKRIQRTSSGRSISVEHSHGHEHERDFELHDHAHGVKATDSSHRHVHKHELLLDNESISSPTAIGVGVLHGIGVETPTQIAIFVATTQATGKAGGLLILLFWVVGLILANSAIALLSIGANDWLRTHTVVYRVLAAIIGIVSVIVGILVLIEKDGILPAF
jgi:ABC-type nickel/cobalt efflux system permease component RcnA